MVDIPELEPRLARVLDRLIERTEAGEVKWETGAPVDSYAVTVADIRFRIRSQRGDGQAPYVLDFQGQPIPQVESNPVHQSARNAQLLHLYEVAKRSAFASIPDLLRNVEEQLGLIEGG